MSLLMLVTSVMMTGYGIFLFRDGDAQSGVILFCAGTLLWALSYAVEWLDRISGQLGAIGAMIDKDNR